MQTRTHSAGRRTDLDPSPEILDSSVDHLGLEAAANESWETNKEIHVEVVDHPSGIGVVGNGKELVLAAHPLQ